MTYRIVPYGVSRWKVFKGLPGLGSSLKIELQNNGIKTSKWESDTIFAMSGFDYGTSFETVDKAKEALKLHILYTGIKLCHERKRIKQLNAHQSQKSISVPPWKA